MNYLEFYFEFSMYNFLLDMFWNAFIRKVMRSSNVDWLIFYTPYFTEKCLYLRKQKVRSSKTSRWETNSYFLTTLFLLFQSKQGDGGQISLIFTSETTFCIVPDNASKVGHDLNVSIFMSQYIPFLISWHCCFDKIASEPLEVLAKDFAKVHNFFIT